MTYFNYTGVGGSYFGTGLPTSTIITVTEGVIAMTPVPDNRRPVQGGVLVSALVSFGNTTTTTATIQCRQSTLGTSTAVSGNLLANGGNVAPGKYVCTLGTQAGTVVGAGTNFGPYAFQWVDYSGTQPLPVYQITGSCASGGTATVVSAIVSVTPLAS